MKKTIVTIVIVVLVIAAAGALLYSHHQKTQQKAQSSAQQQSTPAIPDGSVPLTKVASTSAGPLAFPSYLPRASVGSVQDNEYSIDSSHVTHVTYKYSEPNPSGSSVQDGYLKDLQITGWKNIQTNGSTITATKGGYNFSVSFSAIDSNTTLVSITYTLTPQQTTNEK